MGYVPKLGQGDAELRMWVKRLEGRFRFDPCRPLSDSGEQELRRDVQKHEKAILDHYRSLRQEWKDLAQKSDPARLRQLRAVKLAEYTAKLEELN